MEKQTITTTCQHMTISNVEFSELAGRIASNAASWASDSLTLKEYLHEPMRLDSIQRFTKKITDILEYINEER